MIDQSLLQHSQHLLILIPTVFALGLLLMILHDLKQD